MKESPQYQEAIAFAKTLGMTEREYLTYLHEKSQSVKSVMLNDSEGFKIFLKEFHTVLVDLTVCTKADETKAAKKERSMEAAADLLQKVSSDPMLLVQMYEHYQYDADDGSNPLVKP